MIEDLRHAGRVFAKHPAYLLTAMLTLAVGIGFTTATFSVLNAVLLRPLPYKEPDRLVELVERALPRFPHFRVSPGHYLFWRDRATAFEGIGAWELQSVNLDTGSGGPERVRADRVTANMFSLLGVAPAAGRGFSEADDREGAPIVALLSYGAWQRRFGGRADAVGRAVFVDRKPATIVGVMPRGFGFLSEDAEMWVPMAFTAKDRQNYGSHYMTAVGRLKPGVTLDRAVADMHAVSQQLAEVNPGSKGWDVQLFGLQDYMVTDVRTTLYVLLGAVSLVLLIACANVANLLLVRGAARQKELAIRSAIGASRTRLLRQLMVEQAALATLSAAAGVLMAAWLLRLMLAMVPDALPRQEGVVIDGRVLAFALALSALTPILFGLLPALQSSRPNLRALLAAGGRSGASVPARRVRTAIVVAEIALATMLLVGAGLLLRSFTRLLNVSPGFVPARAILAGVSLPVEKYRRGGAARALLRRLSRTDPRAAAGERRRHRDADADGQRLHHRTRDRRAADPRGRQAVDALLRREPGLFRGDGDSPSQGAPPDRRRPPRRRAGQRDQPDHRRALFPRAGSDRTPPQDWPGGRRLARDRRGGRQRQAARARRAGLGTGLRVVPAASLLRGVLAGGADPRRRSVRGRAGAAGDPAVDGSGPAARASADAEQPGRRHRPAAALLHMLIGLFSAAALLLAAVGIYSVMAYTVGLRTQEFAIRIAHGARRSDIMRLVLRGAFVMSAGGIAGGLIAAWLMRRFVDSLLFGVTAADTATYAGVAVVLAAAALAASAIPALRATRVDPLTALRAE